MSVAAPSVLPHAARLVALRGELRGMALDGFIVPLTDEHLSEYIGTYAKRLAWLTGFRGSAGSAAVLGDAAVLAIDSRYTLQAREEVSGDDWAFADLPRETLLGWLAENAPQGATIGFDPWLHTAAWVEEARGALAARDVKLTPVAANPIDAVWADQPMPSPAPLVVQGDADAGMASAAKRAEIAQWLDQAGADAVVLSALDSVAWALNVRGSDVPHTPVALAFAIVQGGGTADLFVADGKVDAAVRAHLGEAVRIHDRADFAAALGGFAGRRVAADPQRTVAAITDAIVAGGGTVVAASDPTVLPKAVKNAAEIAGHRAASLRDGAALSRFLRWVEVEAVKGGVTELSAAARLLALRQESGVLRDTSFPTISATGAHAASPHYGATEESDAVLSPGQLYLVDSGGQYADGTTDVTRVVPVGAPSDEHRDRFTRVLKGHIAIATAVFPAGVCGGQIDAFARRPLWEAGLDFGHGTGHGVGSFLSVHEGPQRIAPPVSAGALEPLRAGMIVSNEPGYYKAGDYGIRIENLVLVVADTVPGGDPQREMLAFETLTLAPIERDLIDVKLLRADELAWLNAYHARVAESIAPLLESEDRAWLLAKCAPIAG